jgi:hypothetical protein
MSRQRGGVDHPPPRPALDDVPEDLGRRLGQETAGVEEEIRMVLVRRPNTGAKVDVSRQGDGQVLN